MYLLILFVQLQWMLISHSFGLYDMFSQQGPAPDCHSVRWCIDFGVSSCLVVGNMDRFAEQVMKVFLQDQLLDVNVTPGTLGQLLRKLPADLKRDLVDRLLAAAAAHHAEHEMRAYISHYVKGMYPPAEYTLDE